MTSSQKSDCFLLIHSTKMGNFPSFGNYPAFKASVIFSQSTPRDYQTDHEIQNDDNPESRLIHESQFPVVPKSLTNKSNLPLGRRGELSFHFDRPRLQLRHESRCRRLLTKTRLVPSTILVFLFPAALAHCSKSLYLLLLSRLES